LVHSPQTLVNRVVDAQVKVTALIMTFNHAGFIERAVESALSQEGIEEYEILIAEDCSTDATRAIVTQLAQAHPDRVRLQLSERNLGPNRVAAEGMKNARGQYVALLDGDDYWTSPEKLKKQADLLDRHRETAICFHNAMVVYEDGSEAPHPFHTAQPSHYRISSPKPKQVSVLEDVVPGNFVLTNTAMLRNRLVDEFPDWYFQFAIHDWPLYVLHAQHGNLRYVDQVLAAYRVHGGGRWSTRISVLRDPDDLADLIRLHDAISTHVGRANEDAVKRKTGYLAARAARFYTEQGRRREAAYYARRALSDTVKGTARDRLLLELTARPRLAHGYFGIRRGYRALFGARRAVTRSG
jgi:glycosyltransferase involved in cell wall biosynthesis